MPEKLIFNPIFSNYFFIFLLPTFFNRQNSHNNLIYNRLQTLRLAEAALKFHLLHATNVAPRRGCVEISFITCYKCCASPRLRWNFIYYVLQMLRLAEAALKFHLLCATNVAPRRGYVEISFIMGYKCCASPRLRWNFIYYMLQMLRLAEAVLKFHLLHTTNVAPRRGYW